MGRRLLTRWESLAPRHRVLVGIPLAFLVLFAFHEAFFPLLSVPRSATYAFMECVPIALVLAWATQNELRRREAARVRALESQRSTRDGGLSPRDAELPPRADEPEA